MGFECCYFYHEKIENDYNKEEKKTFKKKVGDPFDDIPIERLASAILAQYARRDIFIVDVEVSELSKKKISFKETKNGIILKNKKFLFEGGCEDLSSLVIQDITEPVQNTKNEQSVVVAGSTAGKRPINHVIFCPNPKQINETKHLKLTMEKKYPVFEKRIGKDGLEVYLITDDLNREQLLSEIYFVPSTNLVFDGQLGFTENIKKENSKLLWSDTNSNQDMPNIRGR